MAWYLTAAGEAYTGDRGIRSDGTFDVELPERPTNQYVWHVAQWVLQSASPDWLTLEMSLRSTDLFAKAFMTASTNAWSLLLATLHSTAPSDDAGRMADFAFAIAVIRMGLTEDFTTEQLTRFNAILETCSFPFRVI